jgi:hypothetical protein
VPARPPVAGQPEGWKPGRAGARHPVLYAAAVVRMMITGPALRRRTCDKHFPRGIASRQRAPVRVLSLPDWWLHPGNTKLGVVTRMGAPGTAGRGQGYLYPARPGSLCPTGPAGTARKAPGLPVGRVTASPCIAVACPGWAGWHPAPQGDHRLTCATTGTWLRRGSEGRYWCGRAAPYRRLRRAVWFRGPALVTFPSYRRRIGP